MKKQWFHIMLVVAEGPCHGAEIQRRVTSQTLAAVKLYPVTLYRSLDQLAEHGLIHEVPEPQSGGHNEKRRYYEITLEGRRALADEATHLEASARLAHAVLNRSGAS